jgi:hypothetical protein
MTVRVLVRSIRSNPRAVATGAVVGVGVFLLIGLVTGLVPNSFYVRMVPRTPVDYLFLTVTSLLAAVYAAQRLATELPATRLEDDDRSGSEDRWAMGGMIGGFLAVGCPTCNVFLLALFGSSALTTYFDPLRPVLGVLAVVILTGLIYVRHRRTCPTCER